MPTERAPRFIPLGAKLALATLTLLVVMSALAAVALLRNERQSLFVAKQVAAGVIADLLASSLVAPLDFDDREAIDAECGRVQRSRDVVAVRVFDAKGAPLYPRGADAQKGAPGDGATLTADGLQISRTLQNETGKHLGAAIVTFSLAREEAAYEEGRMRIVWLSVAMGLGAALALVLLARQLIVKPLSTLAKAAERMGEGEVAARVDLPDNDEIGRLGAAFNQMADAIADRERRLTATSTELQEVLDHTGQAITVIDAGGRCEAIRSREADRVLGAGLEGSLIAERLYPTATASDVEARAFREWLAVAPGVPDDDFDELAALAPTEVTIPRGGGDPCVVEIELRRIPGGAMSPRTMLLATDVTRARKLARESARREEEHARQLAMMQRLAAAGGHIFASFVEATRARLGRCVELLRTADEAALESVFALVHTIKGEARAFGLHALGDEAHAIEDAVAERPVRPTLIADVRASIERCAAAIEGAESAFVEASPIGRVALDQITVSRSELARLLGACGDRDDDVARVARRLAARPFGECVGPIAERADEWARSLGKRARVVVEGRACPVPPDLATELPGIMAHLVRNAVAHGIETPAERDAADKPAAGTITLVAEPRGDGCVVTVEDDGRGIDEEAVQRRAHEKGLPPAPIGELIFADSVSTAGQVGDIAGRGVGLGAAREAARSVGYELALVARRPARYVLESRRQR